jgi:hypothetical protein
MVGETIERGTDAWNIAQGYTALKILKPLVEMDKLVKIAIYGYENIEDAFIFQTQPAMKTQMRIEALQRIIDTLRELFENSEFAMKKSMTPETLAELQTRTEKVEQVLGAITKENLDMRTGQRETQINEEHFSTCLNELRNIKQAIPKPLNENALIFPSSDEVDLEKIKLGIIEGG